MAKMTLDDLVTQLRAVYGSELVAVVLYGSAARGDHIPQRSDYNVLVVVEIVSMAHLRKESAVAKAWNEAGNPPPLTLTRAEWRASADIFPMEYSDILEHHKVLAGVLPLDGMAVDREHLRLQLEYEVMAKLLRLRHSVLAASGEKAMLELLKNSFSTMMALFRAVWRLDGQAPPADHDAVIRGVAERAGFDPRSYLSVAAHARGASLLTKDDAERVMEGYLASASSLATYLDRLTPP